MTRQRTRTTTSSRRSSSRCAVPIPTRASTTSRRCSRAVRMRYIARRMIVLASEDIGNADPRALLVAVAAAQAVEHVGLPEARLNLSQAAIYLARAEVERELHGAEPGRRRRAGTRGCETAQGAPRRFLVRPPARP